MKLWTILLAATSLLSSRATFGANVCAYTPKLDEQLGRAVDSLVSPYERTHNFSGVIVVGRGESILVQRAYGPANVELGVPNRLNTIFHVASVSKPLTAAAVLALVQDGKLALEDPLSKFFPDYPRGQEILVRHLLTHSSGIVDINGFPAYQDLMRSPATLEQLIAVFRDKPLKFTPGTQTSYSNSNYNLLARIIEIVSGQSFSSFMNTRIFLGLPSLALDEDPQAIVRNRASGYVPVGKDAVANAPYLNWRSKTGNGSLMTTAEDLYRWTCSYQHGFVVNPRLVEQSTTAQIDQYGFGWSVTGTRDQRQVEATGRSPGFTAAVEYFPSSELTVIIVSNSYSSLSQGLAGDVALVAQGKAATPMLPKEASSVESGVMALAAGRYQFGQDFYTPMMGATLRADGGDLWMNTSTGENIFLIPISKDRWVDRLYGGVIRIESGSGSQEKSLVWTFGKDFRAMEVKN